MVIFFFLFIIIFTNLTEKSFCDVEKHLDIARSLYSLNQKAIYYISTTDKLIKWNSHYQEKWTKKVKTKDIKQIQNSFNQLLILDKKGRLTCINSEYGYVDWEKNNTNIKQILLYHPYIYYINNSGNIGCLDILSGNKIWINTKDKATQIYKSPNISDIIAVNKNQLWSIDEITGQEKKPTPINFNITNVLYWKNKIGLIITKNSIYKINFHNHKISKIKHIEIKKSRVIDRDILVVTKENNLIRYNLSTNKQVWENTDFKKKNGEWFLTKQRPIFISKDLESLIIFEYKNGKKIDNKKLSTEKDEKIWQVTKRQDEFEILSNKKVRRIQ